MNLVGAQIRVARYQRGWSQAHFAAKLQLAGLDISRSAVSKIESRLRHVTDDELVAMLHVLQISLDDVLPKRDDRLPFRDYLHAALRLE